MLLCIQCCSWLEPSQLLNVNEVSWRKRQKDVKIMWNSLFIAQFSTDEEENQSENNNNEFNTLCILWALREKEATREMKRNEMETLLLLWFLISNRSKRTKNRFLLWSNFGWGKKNISTHAAKCLCVCVRASGGACVFTCISLEAPSLCKNKSAYRCAVLMYVYTCAYMPVHDTIDKSEIFVDHLLCGTLFTSEIEAVVLCAFRGTHQRNRKASKTTRTHATHTHTRTHILHCPVNQFIISRILFHSVLVSSFSLSLRSQPFTFLILFCFVQLDEFVHKMLI